MTRISCHGGGWCGCGGAPAGRSRGGCWVTELLGCRADAPSCSVVLDSNDGCGRIVPVSMTLRRSVGVSPPGVTAEVGSLAGLVKRRRRPAGEMPTPGKPPPPFPARLETFSVTAAAGRTPGQPARRQRSDWELLSSGHWGHMTALKGQSEHRTVAGDSTKRSGHQTIGLNRRRGSEYECSARSG